MIFIGAGSSALNTIFRTENLFPLAFLPRARVQPEHCCDGQLVVGLVGFTNRIQVCLTANTASATGPSTSPKWMVGSSATIASRRCVKTDGWFIRHYSFAPVRYTRVSILYAAAAWDLAKAAACTCVAVALS
jgi:hypothetical protein